MNADQISNSAILECADLSALWSLATRRQQRRDRSRRTKAVTSHRTPKPKTCHITNVRAIYLGAQLRTSLVTNKQATKVVTTNARKAQGEGTRKAILEAAVHIASAEGLEGLTIGRLAAELAMSKSGLFAHFGSKEDLQVATVETARAIFIREVIRPAFETAQGLTRLWNLCDTWLSYVQKGVFRGGCFFAAAAAEFDGRPGPVRDRIAEIMKEWLTTLRSTIIEAQNAGQLAKDIDATQLAFEFN